MIHIFKSDTGFKIYEKNKIFLVKKNNKVIESFTDLDKAFKFIKEKEK